MIYIRADINIDIATGHFMRCMAIGDAIRQRGEDVTFITADHEGSRMLEENGFPNIVLETKWDNMESELQVLKPLVQKNNIHCILIDSYYVTEKYLKELSTLTKTAYIDDINKFIYPVHELICYALYWRKFHYSEHYKDTALHLGTQFVPLRKEFYFCEKKNIKKEIENVLIVSGGSDNQNIQRKFLYALDEFKFRRIDLISGVYFKKFDELVEEFAGNRNIFLHKNVHNMRQYFETADLVISAGGSTLYELCACGTPTISYTLADNQFANVKEFDKAGIITYAGDIRNNDITLKIIKEINNYNFQERSERSKRMQKLVDGKGAMRIAEILLN